MAWTRIAATVTGLVLCGWTASSIAADDEYGRSGPYVGASGLYAFESFDGSAGSTTPDDSWGYDLTGGYRFNEYFALQINWQHMIEFADSTGDTELWLISADAKFFPLHGIVQPYALMGAGYSSVDDSRAASPPRNTAGAGFRFAGGLDFYITRNWALMFEAGYVLNTSGRSDYGAIPLTFGVIYRFY